MRAWLQVGAAALVVFGASWGGATWYWRATNQLPSTTDLVLYLVVLPLALMTAFVLARRALSTKDAAPAPAMPVTPDTGPATSTGMPALSMVAAALRTAHGNSAEELADALADHKARAALDEHLTDDDGYPILSARTTVTTDDVQDEFRVWLSEGTLLDPGFNEAQWRALALGSAVVGELAASAAAHSALHTAEAAMLDATSGVPMLQLVVLLPQGWNEAQRRTGTDWLRHSAAQWGWPLARISASVAPAGQLPAPTIAQLAHHAATSEEPLVAIVLACDSHISEASVRDLAAAGKLFTSTNQQGLIPGEGAAGLLLADARQAALIDAGDLPRLQCSAALRNASADTARKPDASVLTALGAQQLKGAALDGAGLAMLVSDSDLRTSRYMEIKELVKEAAPQLDTADEVQHTGIAMGACGAASYLAALALARHHAIELNAPVLCASAADPFARSVALIRPGGALAAVVPIPVLTPGATV